MTALTTPTSEQLPSDPGAQIVAANMARRKSGKQANTLSDFEPKQDRVLAEEEQKLPSMEDMLGNAPDPLIRRRHEDDKTRKFYPMPPKLSAIKTLMSSVQSAGYGEIGNAMLMIELATLYLYVDRGEDAELDAASLLSGEAILVGKRRARMEELEDFLELDDLPLLKKMNEKYLNVILGGDVDASKNA